MPDIEYLRKITPNIISIGSHKPILQSMLDYDFLSGKNKPSLKAIIAADRRYERYFFGNKETLIPVFKSVTSLPEGIKKDINLFFNTTSARRAISSSIEIFETLPNVIGGTIFAENVPEQHSLSMYQYITTKQKFIIGPASVGIIIPGHFKIGAIGGTDYRQLIDSKLFTPGAIAVISASGGMVGEIIRVVAQQNKRISFALSFGGDRFPVLSPKDAFLLAQQDTKTEIIIYYGELGGNDEYEIAELLKTKQITKKVICFIAGTVSELFDQPPQFGHAKAIAKNQGESAREKRDSLKKAGAIVPESFSEFIRLIHELPSISLQDNDKLNTMIPGIRYRKKALIVTNISDDKDGEATILGEKLIDFVKRRSFASIVTSMFLARNNISKELESFIDLVLRLAVDHGPYVSGAVNTIITARAGKDLISSLAAGLLTIGPRFGGAVNQAAENWLNGVIEKKKAYDFVEDFASKKIYIQGIGHKKYRIDFPDPRVDELLEFTDKLSGKRFTSFALEVQKITTAKKGNLILNVDGAIAAILLDLLSEKENLDDNALKELTEIEFFNAIFVLSRSVGFISHFLDQKRLDEGLFRLPEDLVTTAQINDRQ